MIYGEGRACMNGPRASNFKRIHLGLLLDLALMYFAAVYVLAVRCAGKTADVIAAISE